MFAFIELQNFYTRNQDASPLAVVRDRMVLEPNMAAYALGVRAGMSLREARTLASGVQWVDFLLEDYRENRQAWLQSLLGLSHRIESDLPHRAWVDLRAHPRPAEVLETWMDVFMVETGYSVRVGLARSKWVSKHFANQFSPLAAQIGGIEIEPICSLEGFLAPLSPRVLPLDLKHIARLEFLGFRTNGQIASAPLSLLTAHFGKVGAQILRVCKGQDIVPFQPNFPEDALSIGLNFEGGIEDRQILDSAFTTLSRELIQMLVTRDAEAQEIEVFVELAEGEFLQLKRTFAKPMRNLDTLRISIQSMFEQLHVAQPVTGVSVLLSRLDSSPQAQSVFVDLASHSDRYRSAERSLRHVRTIFGEKSLVRAAEIVLPRRQQLLRVWKDAIGWQ